MAVEQTSGYRAIGRDLYWFPESDFQQEHITRFRAANGARRIAELLNQRDDLLMALEIIAYDDEVSYLACSNLPHCSQNPHNEQCAVGIARAALTKAGEA